MSTGILLEDLKPGLYSHYKPFLKRDAGFFRRIKKVIYTLGYILPDWSLTITIVLRICFHQRKTCIAFAPGLYI